MTLLARADEVFIELRGADRDGLGKLIGAFRAAIESQEEDLISEVRARLSEVVSTLRANHLQRP